MNFPKYIYRVATNNTNVSQPLTSREDAREQKRSLEADDPTSVFRIYRVKVDSSSTTHIR